MGEKGNVLSAAQPTASSAPSLTDRAAGIAGDAASFAQGTVVGAASDVAHEHVRGHIEGVVARAQRQDEEAGDETDVGTNDEAPA